MSKCPVRFERKAPWRLGKRGMWIPIVAAFVISIAVVGFANALEPAHAAPARVRGNDYDAVYVDLPNGKRVICVFYHAELGRAISCDWSHQR